MKYDLRRPFGFLAGICAALSAAGAAADGAAEPKALQGFSPTHAATEVQWETRFDSDLSPADLSSWMQRLSAAPNQVGSAHDKDNAQFLLQKFRDWGWEAAIEEFSVLYPTPREERVELVSPNSFVAALREPPVPGDATSTQVRDELPPYNVYGADGDVTAPLVYVNQGMPDDYDELERQGVSVKGHIVIARYGGGWRGLKPKLASEHGAVGCLIYSDPRDDGYGAGDTYPDGGFRPRESVQRGSVADITLYSGDPLTPGVGATQTAHRLALKDARTILKIPVLPLSYADAEPLLAALRGRVAPPAWRGGLPIAYHLGPGPATVHLKVVSDWKRRPIYDVIAKIRGSEEPDTWILRGNHHDAWVFGAEDPFSGHVALMAEAQSIGKLLKAGWRPRRTLVYASWDGEEPGLLGSTEWVETHAAELRAKAALYVNSDTNSRGFFIGEGSHALQAMVNEVTRDVTDPESGDSVRTRALAAQEVAAYDSGRMAEATSTLTLGALGSGSDYTPFLQHLGVASLNIEFRGEGEYGVYHSAYDSFDHFKRFVDPGFMYAVALAQVTGRIVLRAADADLLPGRQADFAISIGEYSSELQKLLDSLRAKNRELGRLLDEGAFKQAADPTKPRAAPPRLAQVPYLSFAQLQNAIERLQTSARAFDKEYQRLTAVDDESSHAARARMNAAIASLEDSLTEARGLPNRPWYRHMIYAPGLRTGYGAKTLPGIREALEDGRWDEAGEYMSLVARALNAYSARLEQAVGKS